MLWIARIHSMLKSQETVHVVTSAVLLCTTASLSASAHSMSKNIRSTCFASIENPNISRRWMHNGVSRNDQKRRRDFASIELSKFDRRCSINGVQTLTSSARENQNYKPRKLCVAPMMDWTDRFDRYFLRTMSKHTWLYTEMVTTGAIIFGDQVNFSAPFI